MVEKLKFEDKNKSSFLYLLLALFVTPEQRILDAGLQRIQWRPDGINFPTVLIHLSN